MSNIGIPLHVDIDAILWYRGYKIAQVNKHTWYGVVYYDQRSHRREKEFRARTRIKLRNKIAKQLRAWRKKDYCYMSSVEYSK